MVIQGYNVSVSSQRTSLSIQSTTMSEANSLNSAKYAGTTGQEGKTAEIPDQSTSQNSGNNAKTGVGQAQNSGNNGQTGNGNTQNTGNNAQTGVGQAQNSGNNGQTGNGQGQNVNNQGQSNADIFKSLLNNARGEGIDRLARGSPASFVTGPGNQKIPTNPKELRARLSQMLYEMLTGRYSKVKPKHQQKHQHQHMENVNEGRGFDISGLFIGAFRNDFMQRTQSLSGVQFESLQYESETVSYQANGVIHTADGKTITVDISMNMSREFVSFMGISGGSGALVDPLVINYGGTAASLTGEKFMFDLTMDGNLDSLSILGEGSGFLAIDRNGDGIINDGSELFGPSTGCGFSELRKYDTDGNGWIDANDEIFDKLVVWSRDKDGNDTVYTLKELGIGAIFLGDISTEFSFKGERNETLGVMRSTSFFLKQNGGAGTLSHIDLML